MVVIVVTGCHGCGKTSNIHKILSSYKELSITGVTERAFIVNGRRVAYFFKDLYTNQLFLAAKRRSFEKLPDRAFQFSVEGFARAKKAILRPAQMVVADELGFLEADEDGLWPAVKTVLERRDAEIVILGINPAVVGEISKKIQDIIKS